LYQPPAECKRETAAASRLFVRADSVVIRAMRDALLVYFAGEKHAGTLAAVVGVVAVAGKHRHGLSSVALALALQGSFFLAFDLIAERRGATYLAALQSAPR
jgi:hypothetical protein